MPETIRGRATSIGRLPVRRILPYRHRRSVGPFVFVDEMGPVDFAPGEGIDVPPHPHIGLSTLTYMFEGGLDHRDSTGVHQAIEPGAVNWMTAGEGVTHSERTGDALRAAGHTTHGLQVWVALPEEADAVAPSFQHVPAADLRVVERGGARLRIVAGEAFGASSPVAVHAPLFHVDATFEAAGEITLEAAMGERGAVLIDGEARLGEVALERGAIEVWGADEGDAVLSGSAGARLILLGGPALPREPLMHWNFVAWEPGAIERAKRRWADGGFPAVPGDPG